MVKCMNCGHEVDDNDRFCNRCGVMVGYSNSMSRRPGQGQILPGEPLERKCPEKKITMAIAATAAISAAALILLISLAVLIHHYRVQAQDVIEQWQEESEENSDYGYEDFGDFFEDYDDSDDGEDYDGPGDFFDEEEKDGKDQGMF